MEAPRKLTWMTAVRSVALAAAGTALAADGVGVGSPERVVLGLFVLLEALGLAAEAAGA